MKSNKQMFISVPSESKRMFDSSFILDFLIPSAYLNATQQDISVLKTKQNLFCRIPSAAFHAC